MSFEKKLKEETKKKLAQLARMSNYPWWEWDVVNNIVRYNPLKVTQLGYELKEFENVGYEAFTSLIHPDDYGRTMNSMMLLLNGTSNLYTIDYRIKRKDGHYSWYMDRGYALERDDKGSPTIVRGLVIDLGSSLSDDAAKDIVFQTIRRHFGKNDSESMITICAVCKRIRLDNEEWIILNDEIDELLHGHISHGVCPDCIRKLYGDDFTEEYLKELDP